MSGNVLEWCWDWSDASGSDRVDRGGSWNSSADRCSVSDRLYYYPSGAGYDLGFRLARSAKD